MVGPASPLSLAWGSPGRPTASCLGRQGGPSTQPGYCPAPWASTHPVRAPAGCQAHLPEGQMGPRAALSLALHMQINFCIFIHILHILVAKLRAHQMRYTDYKLRWVWAGVLETGSGQDEDAGGSAGPAGSGSAPAGWPSPR